MNPDVFLKNQITGELETWRLIHKGKRFWHLERFGMELVLTEREVNLNKP